MAIFDGQLEVTMIQQGPSMTIFDDQFKVMVMWLESSSKADRMAVGMAEGVVDQRTWCLAFHVSFSKAFVLSFEDTRNIEKQRIYLDTTPLRPVQHIPSLLGHTTFHLDHIATVDLNFWTGLQSQLLILFSNPQPLISTKYDPTTWILLFSGL